jgi:hypothetical protein
MAHEDGDCDGRRGFCAALGFLNGAVRIIMLSKSTFCSIIGERASDGGGEGEHV